MNSGTKSSATKKADKIATAFLVGTIAFFIGLILIVIYLALVPGVQ